MHDASLCDAPDELTLNISFSADVGFESYKPDTRAQIFSDGTIVWYSPVIYTSPCKIRVTWFPFDTQVCDLTFVSWAYDGLLLDLYPEKSADASSNRCVYICLN